MEEQIGFSGHLGTKVIRGKQGDKTMAASLRPVARLPLGLGRLFWTPDKGSAIIPGGIVFGSDLRAALIRDGEIVYEKDFGSGLVTTAGVTYGAADMAGGAGDISALNWHGTGTGTTAEAVGQTALVTAAGPARVSGTQSNPSAGVYRTVATLAYTSTLAITEWGLFSASTAGTMWDRRVFAAINVVNGDSIQFTYDLTWNAGG